MKNPYSILSLLICLGIWSSCKKDAPDFVKPGEFSLGTIINGGNNGGGTAAANSYQPLTKGSYWTYEIEALGVANIVTYILTGNTSTINGKPYYEVTANIPPYGTQLGYYHYSNNTYSQRANTFINGITIELQVLKDNIDAGQTWTAPVTDNGLIQGVPSRIIGIVKEKGISRTVGGKTFNNVIYTSLDMQYDMLGDGSFSTVITYEFYMAKGVGIIENRSVVSGKETSHAKLIDYGIK